MPKHICSYENCEYKTSRKENLQNHINRVHLKIPIEKKYSCDQCGQSYSKISFLKDGNFKPQVGHSYFIIPVEAASHSCLCS